MPGGVWRAPICDVVWRCPPFTTPHCGIWPHATVFAKGNASRSRGGTDHSLTMPDPQPRGLLTPLAVAAAALALLAYYVGRASPLPPSASPTPSLTPSGASQTPLASLPANSSSALNFGPLRFAGHANWIFRDDVTAAQVVISECVESTPLL